MRLVHSRQYLEELGEDGEGGVLVVHALAVGHVGCVDLLARQDRAIPLLEVVGDPGVVESPRLPYAFFHLARFQNKRWKEDVN